MTIGILKLSIAASTSTLLLATAAPAETKDVTVTLPVNFCLANWPFYVAAESRLFADEGLEVSMQGMDGSSAAIQAVLAGQAQIAVTAPADMLAAKGAGADVIGFYSFYQKLPFRLITPAESEIKSLAHLEGKTIGISNPGGGDAIFMRSLMNHASLGEGDYEEMAVGEGNMAASAFTGGVVDAYSASFVEEIIFSGMEVPYVALESEWTCPGSVPVGCSC